MTATLKNKNYKRSQKGRSMVEMLGVLAIIGVLSVGGVYGYGVAMKKHKANELLHQASMLATTISAQIQSKGQLPQNIENFGDAKYGTFSTPEKVNDEQFKMEITGMDSAVCEQMEKMSGGMVRQAECDGTTLTLTYNNNLSSDKVAADYNDDTTGEKCEDAGYKWCSELSTPACKKDCCSGVTLNSCQESCDSSTGEITNKDDGTGCTTSDGKEGTCDAGVCEEATADYTGVKCTDYQNNTECGGVGSGWYCAFSPSPELYADGCKTDADRGDGVCTAVGSGTSIKGGAYLKSPGTMDWWSAYSWCKGNDMEPLTGTIAGKSLTSYYENWDGNGSLYQYFEEGISFWTGHVSDDPCGAWGVGAYSDYELITAEVYRNYNDYALCE